MTTKQVHDLLDKFDETFRSEFGGYVGYTNDGEYKFEYNNPGFVIKNRTSRKTVFKEKMTKFENIHEFRARVELRLGQEFLEPNNKEFAKFVNKAMEEEKLKRSGFAYAKIANVDMDSGAVTYKRPLRTGKTASGLGSVFKHGLKGHKVSSIRSSAPPTKLPHLVVETIVQAFESVMNTIGGIEVRPEAMERTHDLTHGYTMQLLTHVNPSGFLDRQGYMRISEPTNSYAPAKSGQYVQTGLWDQRMCDNFKGEGVRAIRNGLEHVVGEPEDMGEFSGLGDIASALQGDE